jgi:two-component sensor histidine kinase
MAHADGIATDPIPELESGQSTKSTRHAWQGETLRLAVDAAGIALWAWNVDTDEFTMDERGFALWGVEWTERVTFEALSEHIHPADRDRVRAGFAATRAVLGPYETDFRILVNTEIRWVSARGQGQDVGIVGRAMFGVFLDVTGRKQAEEGHELLAGEMSHRVKNLLSIAAALTVITSRSTSTTTDMARELTLRLTALGRAHDLVRPLPGGQGQAALLGDLLSVLLAPYDDLGAFTGRIRVAVERMGVGEGAATSLALGVHELATNALKYGSLSAKTGTLDVSSKTHDGEISLIWIERGGPLITAAPQRVGYGSKLVERSISRQLGGSITYDWSSGGLTATLRLDREKLKV